MDREDKNLQALYTELYDNTHASDELKGMVRTMTEKGKKRVSTVVKAGAALAAAAIILVGGTVAVTATHKPYRGQYTTVYLNGEETKARCGEFDGTNVHIVEAEKDGYTYTVYVRGRFDEKTQQLYIRDVDKHAVIASTDPEQELNLYDDIDKVDGAYIDGDILHIEDVYTESPDRPSSENISLSFDMEDGVKDGIFKFDRKDYTTYVVSPEGYLIEAMKSKGTLSFEEGGLYAAIWGFIWGEEDFEVVDGYTSSDGMIIE